MAFVNLTVHILTDFMHRHMSWAFNQYLYSMFPRYFSQLSEHIQFKEL